MSRDRLGNQKGEEDDRRKEERATISILSNLISNSKILILNSLNFVTCKVCNLLDKF